MSDPANSTAREHSGDFYEIERLKYRYLRALDTKAWDDFADTLTEDVRGDYGTAPDGAALKFSDRESLVGYLREAMGGRGVITEHAATHPEIDIDADGYGASGTWYLHDRVIVAEFDFMLIGAAIYEDRYRLTPSGWKIASTGYKRTYEATISLKGLDFSLTPGAALAESS